MEAILSVKLSSEFMLLFSKRLIVAYEVPVLSVTASIPINNEPNIYADASI